MAKGRPGDRSPLVGKKPGVQLAPERAADPAFGGWTASRIWGRAGHPIDADYGWVLPQGDSGIEIAVPTHRPDSDGFGIDLMGCHCDQARYRPHGIRRRVTLDGTSPESSWHS